MFIRSVAVSVAVSVLLTGCLHEEGGHAHGTAEMKIVTDGNKLAISFELPGTDIVGFEHKPKNDEEKGKIEKQKAALKQFQQLVRFDRSTFCQPKNSHVDFHSDHGHGHFNVHYEFECQNMDTLKELQLGLFQSYSNLKKLKVEGIFGKRNFSKTVEAPAAVLGLE